MSIKFSCNITSRTSCFIKRNLAFVNTVAEVFVKDCPLASIVVKFSSAVGLVVKESTVEPATVKCISNQLSEKYKLYKYIQHI